MKNNRQTTDWLIKGISEEQLKTERALAFISNKISLKRHELKMDQKQFAKYMNVTQGLVSRWENGRYNFTISNLISICEKLNLSLNIKMLDKNKKLETIIFVKEPEKNIRNWSTWKPTNDNIIYGGVGA